MNKTVSKFNFVTVLKISVNTVEYFCVHLFQYYLKFEISVTYLSCRKFTTSSKSALQYSLFMSKRT